MTPTTIRRCHANPPAGTHENMRAICRTTTNTSVQGSAHSRAARSNRDGPTRWLATACPIAVAASSVVSRRSYRPCTSHGSTITVRRPIGVAGNLASSSSRTSTRPGARSSFSRRTSDGSRTARCPGRRPRANPKIRAVGASNQPHAKTSETTSVPRNANTRPSPGRKPRPMTATKLPARPAGTTAHRRINLVDVRMFLTSPRGGTLHESPPAGTTRTRRHFHLSVYRTTDSATAAPSACGYLSLSTGSRSDP